MATRQGGHHGLTLPGPMPWLGRGQHPLAGPLAAAAIVPAAWSQPTTLPAQTGRPAAHARSTAIPLPHFAPSQLSLPMYGAAHPSQPAPRAAGVHQPAASLRAPVRASQLPASQPQGFYWSQRSQLDNIVVGTQLLHEEEEEEQVMGEHAAALEVGSAPAADDRFGGAIGPSQPETVGMAARLLVGQLKNTGSHLDDQPALGGLTIKLEEVSGKQSALEAVLDKVKGDLAVHSTALEGIGTTCAQLLEAVHSISGASDGIAARLQQLLAEPPATTTGDMATQTAPQLGATAQPGGAALPLHAQQPAGILQTFGQRRASSAAMLSAMPPPAAALLPPRGLSAGAATAAAAAAMPTTTPTTSPGSAAAPTALAAPAGVVCKQQQPTATAVQSAAQDSARKGPGKPSSTAKRRQPKRASQPAAPPHPAMQSEPTAKPRTVPQPAAAAEPKPTSHPAAPAKPQGSFSRKRVLESSSQQMAQRQQRPSKQQRPAAELLFDSLFGEEQENSAPAVAPQAQPAVQLVASAAADPSSGKGQSDLAAKVQARLEKHRARFGRRRNASQRQLEEEE